jgi:hypothetical protein
VLLGDCAAECVPLAVSPADGDPLGATDGVTDGVCAADSVTEGVWADEAVPLTVATADAVTLGVATADRLALGDWAAEAVAVGVSGAEREGLGDCSAEGDADGVDAADCDAVGVTGADTLPLALRDAVLEAVWLGDCVALAVTEAVLDVLPLPLCDPLLVLVPEALANGESVVEGVGVPVCDPLPVSVVDVVPVAVCVAVALPLPDGVHDALADAVEVSDPDALALALKETDSDAVPVSDADAPGVKELVVVGEPVPLVLAVAVGESVLLAVPDVVPLPLAVGDPLLVVVDVSLTVAVLLADAVALGVLVRVMDGDAVLDGVAVRLGDAVGSSDSHAASHRTPRTCRGEGRSRMSPATALRTARMLTLTRRPVYSPTYTFSTPVVFSHATPMGLLTVAERALPPLPDVVHDPVPRNVCTTLPAVMRRAMQPPRSTTTRLPSGSTDSDMGWLKRAALTSPPAPLLPAVPSPPSVVMMRVARSTDRRRWLPRSQITSRPPHTAMPSGELRRADKDDPPSPLLPLVPALFTHVSTSPAAPDGGKGTGVRKRQRGPQHRRLHAPVVRLCSRTRWSLALEMNSPSLPHAATARQLPNAVSLVVTPLSAMFPAARQVPLPATTYTRDVACAHDNQRVVGGEDDAQVQRRPPARVAHLTCDTPTTTQRSVAAMARSPLGRMAPCSMFPSGACVASSPA